MRIKKYKTVVERRGHVKIDFEDERPIFQQIALGIEDAILTGAFEEGE